MEAVEVTGPEIAGTKIWSFIGPTGVGKTTTLAKLAAHFSLRFSKKITLITHRYLPDRSDRTVEDLRPDSETSPGNRYRPEEFQEILAETAIRTCC